MCDRLSDVVTIKPGYSFRSRIEHDPEGEYCVIQPSNVGPAGEVDVSELPLVSGVRPRTYHHVDADAVLFVAYGPRNRAFRFGHLPEKTIASSTFYLLRPKPPSDGSDERAGTLLPGYLTWYLNQPPAQAYFEALRGGVSVQMLRRDALGSLDVPVPSLDVQRRIAEAARLVAEEERLARQLIEKRRLLTDNLLLDKIQNP